MRLTAITWNLQRFFLKGESSIARALGSSSEDWSRKAYDRKLTNVAGCLRTLLPEEPAFAAFSEVESEAVVQDILRASGWQNMLSVDAVVPAPQVDGLDVVLLYNSLIFEERPEAVQSIALSNRLSTRDLLRARLRLRGGPGCVELIALHWPSRMISEGRILRMAHGFYLRELFERCLKYDKAELTDSRARIQLPAAVSLLERWNVPLFAMGDFNDEPFDASLREGVGSQRFLEAASSSGRLTGTALTDPDRYLSSSVGIYNPCWRLPFSDDGGLGGTYYRDAEWRTYDQVLVSHGALHGESRLRFVPDSARIGRLDSFTVAGREVQMGTRTGLPRAFDDDQLGVSDHFPLLFDVEFDSV